MNNLSLYLILAAILGQGIFLLIALRFLPNRNKQANNILFVILLISNLMLLGRIVVGHYGVETVWELATLVDGTIFIFGPLIYCYIRRLLFQESPTYKLQWIHYLPILIYLIYYSWALTWSVTNRVEYYNSGLLFLIYSLIEGLGLVSMTFYIIRSFVLLKSSKPIDKEKANPKASHFLNFFLLALSVFTSLWLINFVNEYFLDGSFKYLSYSAMWISIGGLMYVIGFYSLMRPEVFRTYKSKEKTSNGNGHRLSTAEIETLKEKLRIALDDGELFLDSKISLMSLSKAIGTTTNNLSWLLNNVYGKKFYEFVNEYRVIAFLKLIQQNKHKTTTLYALAMDVGFNSKSTFNKAFKSYTNQTPSAYIKLLVTQ